MGECAEHRRTVYGLWAPLAEQARVAAAVAVGDPAAFRPAVMATTLKVAGVELFAGGCREAGGFDELLVADTRRSTYRRLLLDGDRLVGAIMLGDVTDAPRLSSLLRSGESVPEELLDPIGPGAGAADAQSEDPGATVCSCNAVTRREIVDAIARGGLTTVAQLGHVTRAGTGCGGCSRELEAILRDSRAGNIDETVAKPALGSMEA